jgi:hypothetical protein
MEVLITGLLMQVHIIMVDAVVDSEVTLLQREVG